MALPVAGYVSDNARTQGQVKAALEATIAAVRLMPGAGSSDIAAVIAGGTITPDGTGGVIIVDTEGGASTDDLANFSTTNYPDGAEVELQAESAARVVTVKHAAGGAGQIHLYRSVDYVMDDIRERLRLKHLGTDWYEVGRYPWIPSLTTVAKSSTFTIGKADHGTVFLCTGTYTVNIAAVSGLGNGFWFAIINVGTGLITLDPNSSETIDGVTTLALAQGLGGLYAADGSTGFTCVVGQNMPLVTSIAFNASLTINTALGNYFEIGALTGNVTSTTLSNPYGGHTITIRFKQDGTGGRTVAAISGAKVAGAIDPTANVVSHLTLTYSLADTRWEGYWSSVPA